MIDADQRKRTSFEYAMGQFWFLFDRLEPLARATVSHAGRAALNLNLSIGHRLHRAAEGAALLNGGFHDL